MSQRPQKIGVFDSGVGGLTVYKELLRLLPNESFLYLGDTARVPYGSRSPETIRKYSLQNCLFLIEKGAELIVIACNTATASALPFLQSVLKVPVLGVVEPGVQAALATTRNKKIGVIATEATIRSKVYEHALKAKDASVLCVSRATPLLVPLVEESLFHDKILTPIFEHYLGDFSDTIDTLILGCTHYPILKTHMQNYLTDKVALVDSAVTMAGVVKNHLDSLPIRTETTHGESHIYVTDAPERVRKIAEQILLNNHLNIEKVEV